MVLLTLLLLCAALPQVLCSLRGSLPSSAAPAWPQAYAGLAPAAAGQQLGRRMFTPWLPHTHVQGRGLQALPTPPVTNCTEWPDYCGDLLQCQTPPTTEQLISWLYQVAEPGKPNLKTWCGHYEFATSVIEQCLVKRDLALSGKIAYEVQKATGTDEIDASYCFMVGHCDPDGPSVPNNASLADGVKLCDARFGPDGWTTFFGQGKVTSALFLFPELINQTCGMLSREIATDYGKLACAMGNWHCDVIYCRENYCNDPHYSARYKRYLDPSVTPSCPA